MRTITTTNSAKTNSAATITTDMKTSLKIARLPRLLLESVGQGGEWGVFVLLGTSVVEGTIVISV